MTETTLALTSVWLCSYSAMVLHFAEEPDRATAGLRETSASEMKTHATNLGQQTLYAPEIGANTLRPTRVAGQETGLEPLDCLVVRPQTHFWADRNQEPSTPNRPNQTPNASCKGSQTSFVASGQSKVRLWHCLLAPGRAQTPPVKWQKPLGCWHFSGLTKMAFARRRSEGQKGTFCLGDR